MKNNDLIVKSKTELKNSYKTKDILSFYGIPEFLDKIVSKDRVDILNALTVSGVFMDDLNKISHSKGFFVEIPNHLRKLLEQGKAHFDSSKVKPGNFTPNIRVDGVAGIQGQATISQGVDNVAISNSISNIAMMAMVQSTMAKMDILEQKLDTVITGQKNDRIGIVVGSFHAFAVQYEGSLNEEERRQAARQSYIQMQPALAQLHLQIEEERKILSNVPNSFWSAMWQGFLHPTYNVSKRFLTTYEEFIYDIQLYNKLILLSDIVLKCQGNSFKDIILKNHRPIFDYCNMNIGNDFKQSINYLTQGNMQEVDNILSYNHYIENVVESHEAQSLLIECKPNEVEFIKSNRL